VSRPEALAWARAAREAPGLWHAFADLAERARRDGLTRALVCGMGGSSLTARVLAESFGATRLQTLDTTAPRTVMAAARAADAAPTLFVIASKTGATVETEAFYRLFAARARPEQFVAITDAGSRLDLLARERGFRAAIHAPADVGGRYSALTAFGMVPAALAGIDGGELLRRAQMVDVAAARTIGARLAAAALAGRDKVALRPPAPLAALALWVEQLLAESSGKDGRGVVPLVDDPRTGPRPDTETVAEFATDPLDLGAEFVRWAHATDELCHRLGVNPYNQPDVEDAKALTRAVLSQSDGAPALPVTLSPAALAAAARPGDYLALLLYVPAPPAGPASARAVGAAWSNALGIATTIGYGPTYLHSTGQLHKGGPNNGLFLVVTADDDEDAEIPGLPLTFGRLQRAQALGDVAALLRRGRRVAYVHLTSAVDLAQLVP
jgi:glucose-6-phosphate isomerase